MARTFVIIAFICLAALAYRAESRKAWRPVKADSDEFVPGVEAAPVGSDAISNDIALEETTAEPTTELPTTLTHPKHKARKHGGKHRTRTTSITEQPTTTTTTTTTTVPTTIAFARDASSEGSDEDTEDYDDDETSGKPPTKAGVAASTKTAAPQSVPASAVSKGTSPGQASSKPGQVASTGKAAVGASKKPEIGDNEDEGNEVEDGGDKPANATKQVPAASAATVAGPAKSSPSVAPPAKTLQTTRKAVVTEAPESGEDDGTIVRISIVFNGTEAEGKPGPGKQPGGIASQKPTSGKPAQRLTAGPAKATETKKPTDSPGALAAPNIDETKATKEGEENGGEGEEDEYADESVSPKPKNATGKSAATTAAVKGANATSVGPKVAGNATTSAAIAKNATTKGVAPANATASASIARMANTTASLNQTHPIVGRHKFKKAKRAKKGETHKKKAKKHFKKAKAKAAAEKAAIQTSSQSITGIDSNALFEGRNIVLANSANVSAPPLIPNITSGAGLIVGVITPLPLLSTTKTSLDKLYTGKHKQKISERLKSHNASNDYVAALNSSATTAKVLRDAGTTPWTSANAAVTTGKPEHAKKTGKQKHKEGKSKKHKKAPQKTAGGNQAANSTTTFAGAVNGTAANVSATEWNNQTLFGKQQKNKNNTKHHGDGKGKKKWKKTTTTILPTTTAESKQNKSQVKTGKDEDAPLQGKPDDATSNLIRKINIERNPQQEKVAQQKAAGQKQLETIVKVVTVASSSKPKKHKKTTAAAIVASTNAAEFTTDAVSSTKTHPNAKKHHSKGKTTTPPAESEELHSTQNYSEIHKLFSTDKNYKFIGGEGDNPAFIQAGPSVESEAN